VSVTILQGDCIEMMRTMEAQSVNCCVTSPPYFGLRDYGCDGQLGLEATPEEYVAKMVAVFQGVRRVLRDDGTLWLNLGDSYAANGISGLAVKGETSTLVGSANTAHTAQRKTVPHGLKSKDLVGIPWRVAFALQSDGWYLRQDIIWHKPNPMPESVTDRCTKAHEYVFLLSKSARYYYDADAIKEPAICGSAPGNTTHKGTTAYEDGDEKHRTKSGLVAYAEKVRASAKKGSFNGKTEAMANTGQNAFRAVTDTRNKRSVWTVSTKTYKAAHFATYPPELIRPCILAGCPVGGTVLDPFGGSGTTGEVAEEEGRNSILIELNPEYIPLIEKRTAQMGLFT